MKVTMIGERRTERAWASTALTDLVLFLLLGQLVERLDIGAISVTQVVRSVLELDRHVFGENSDVVDAARVSGEGMFDVSDCLPTCVCVVGRAR